MNTYIVAWIIFQMGITIWPFIEAFAKSERCIYHDFEEIKLAFSADELTLHALLSYKLYEDQNYVYSLKDILKAGRWLTVMRVFSVVPFSIIGIIVLMYASESVFVDDLHAGDLINSILWLVFYLAEIIAFVLRFTNKAVHILKCLHPKYKNVSFISILMFTYLKK